MRQNYTGRLSLIKKNIFGGVVREFCFSFTEFFGFDDWIGPGSPHHNALRLYCKHFKFFFSFFYVKYCFFHNIGCKFYSLQTWNTVLYVPTFWAWFHDFDLQYLKYSCEMPVHIFSVSACMTGCNVFKWLGKDTPSSMILNLPHPLPIPVPSTHPYDSAFGLPPQPPPTPIYYNSLAPKTCG